MQLHVSNLCAGYRGRMVLHDFTITPLEAGKVTVLVGPNAAGKSTLLRSLAGLVPATGSLRLGGIDLMGLRLAERANHVAFMPQDLPQGAELTVLESVISALKASPLDGFGGGAQESRLRALAALDRLGILDLASDGIGRLSGGQRQLASLAQAVVRAPRLLTLDEPTSALDLRHQYQVMHTVKALAGEGRIVVAVLHDLTLAAKWADHVIVLDQGRLAAEGPPAEAFTPEILRRVYGVATRVERCSRGGLHIAVDGLA